MPPPLSPLRSTRVHTYLLWRIASPRLPNWIAAVTVAVAAGSAPSCAGNTGGSKPAPSATLTTVAPACGAVLVEPLDPRSTQHLLPGSPPPSYATDPPTSGPHTSGGAVTGVQDQPVDSPLQVAVLEEGGIMVQYRPDLPAADIGALSQVAADKVVVAPNPSLSKLVVATAWRHRLTCRSVDLVELRGFISDRQGKGPG